MWVLRTLSFCSLLCEERMRGKWSDPKFSPWTRKLSLLRRSWLQKARSRTFSLFAVVYVMWVGESSFRMWREFERINSSMIPPYLSVCVLPQRGLNALKSPRKRIGCGQARKMFWKVDFLRGFPECL